MLNSDYIPPATLLEAIEEALAKIACDQTLDNITRITARGNTMRITLTFDRQSDDGFRIITACEERSKQWTIYYAKNLAL